MSLCEQTRKKYFFLAVNTGFALDGLPDQRCCDFYAGRSGNGLYSAIVGNVVIPGGDASNDVCAMISDSEKWRSLSSCITQQGAIAGIQLSSAWPGYRGMKRFVPRVDENPVHEYRRVAAAMSRTFVGEIFDGLQRGTELAIRQGFGLVQLHAAHGYAFNLLIDKRLSRYASMAIERVAQWADFLSTEGIESSVRFSLWAGSPLIDADQQDNFVQAILDLPVTYFDVSAGYYNIDKRLIYPSNPEMIKRRCNATLELAKTYPDRQFIVSGKSYGAWDTESLPNAHVGICRDLIANSNFLKDRSDGCKNCMKCHYFSRNALHLTCGTWKSS